MVTERHEHDFQTVMDALYVHPYTGDPEEIGIRPHPSTQVFVNDITTLAHAPRIFGGQFLGQSLQCAALSLPASLPVHCLQSQFIRGGIIDQPVYYATDILRFSKTYANVMVTAYQNKEVLYTALIAFHEPGSPARRKVDLTHQPQMPIVPEPETLPVLEERLRGWETLLPQFVEAIHPIEWRYVDDPPWDLRLSAHNRNYNRVWIKPHAQIPGDTNVHAAFFAFSSDSTILDTILMNHNVSWGPDRVVTLSVNHSIWFHHPLNFNDWHLYHSQSLSAGQGRGMVTGELYHRNGLHCASITQECIAQVMRHADASTIAEIRRDRDQKRSESQ